MTLGKSQSFIQFDEFGAAVPPKDWRGALRAASNWLRELPSLRYARSTRESALVL